MMSAVTHHCASCGNDLPAGARFCASCGARAAPIGRRVTWSRSERHYFGVIPGRSIAAAARTRIGRLLVVARSRLSLAITIVSTRLQAAIERYRLRRRVSQLGRERLRYLQALGDAVYRDDRRLAASTRRQIDELDRTTAVMKEEIKGVDRWAEERIAHARMEGGPTNVVEPEPSPDAPEPPIVPEPQPVPSDPPGPVIVPEPEPVPHEPPGPVIVPEPQQPTK